MLARIDTLSLQIDSIRALNESLEAENCTDELHAIVGASKEEVENFRIKFTETEKRIIGRIGTPAESHKYYYDEIADSKIKCLPEFYERFAKMKNILTDFQVVETRGSDMYSVVKGDCLWRISKTSYNNPYLWPAIWDANRVTIVNPDNFEDFIYRKVSDPNLIYPGQVLKVPALNDESRKEAEERSRNFRKLRSRKED
ncbi:MAG: LysM peptidoglycan-binding domain-containing protein [Ignavibacteria bacterium]|nr:LysM peptidoglycan-binding domain-containing protein [Ignavibacteria bacterium]